MFLHNVWSTVNAWTNISRQSNCHYNEFCSYIESRYTEGWLHIVMFYSSQHNSEGPDQTARIHRLCADPQADLGLRFPHMPEDTFLHGAAHFILSFASS